MAFCFVIQPFDSAKFDKRFNDIYRPAIEAAGLEAYRVDQDPGVQVPIESIEQGIRKATVCLADITEDNPNVWYELGFTFAANKPVVMVCSEERPGNKYPFDIQHRSIIPYMADAPSDFEKLRTNLTAKIAAIIKQDALLDRIAEESPIAPVHGLSSPEIMVLAAIAGDISFPGQSTTMYNAKHAAERAGITGMGFNLAIRRLLQKSFVQTKEIYDDHAQETYTGLSIAELGWNWIDTNESNFILITRPPAKSVINDLPF
jgi:hypothetical protein